MPKYIFAPLGGGSNTSYISYISYNISEYNCTRHIQCRARIYIWPLWGGQIPLTSLSICPGVLDLNFAVQDI